MLNNKDKKLQEPTEVPSEEQGPMRGRLQSPARHGSDLVQIAVR